VAVTLPGKSGDGVQPASAVGADFASQACGQPGLIDARSSAPVGVLLEPVQGRDAGVQHRDVPVLRT
jgi:hypothetical protein